nr:MAG TPA: hypothetical protein [Caudoviricetes sp.]
MAALFCSSNSSLCFFVNFFGFSIFISSKNKNSLRSCDTLGRIHSGESGGSFCLRSTVSLARALNSLS